MMDDCWTSAFVQRAREVLHQLKVDRFPLVVKDILPFFGIEYAEEGIQADQFDGCAVKEGDTMGILVNARIPYASRKNFTCAHELGHCLVQTHTKSQYTCSASDMDSFQPSRRFESEANQFPVELLRIDVLERGLV